MELEATVNRGAPDAVVPAWVTVREAAFISGASVESIERLIESGRIDTAPLFRGLRRHPFLLVRAMDLRWTEPEPVEAGSSEGGSLDGLARERAPAPEEVPIQDGSRGSHAAAELRRIAKQKLEHEGDSGVRGADRHHPGRGGR